MSELSNFMGQKAQLISGEFVQMTARRSRHMAGITLAQSPICCLAVAEVPERC